MTSLPLFAAHELPIATGAEKSSPLVGIAKLAAEGEPLREGHQVEYFSLPARSLLNRCTAPYMPFTWTINPYRGCEFACKYCYARYTHEFLELDDVEFEQKIYVKQEAAWLLRRELKRVKPHEEIALGSATDPYQPAEKRYAITRSLLEVLAEYESLELGIITKSNLIVRDIDLLQRISARNKLHISLTITTANAELARILEPRAPRPDLRWQAVSRLVQAGIRTGVMVAPVLPGITDSPEALEAVVRETAAAGGHYLFANPLFLKPCSASVFLPFLQREFPQLAAEYRQRPAGHGFVSRAYRQNLSEQMAQLQRKYGFRSRLDHKRAVEGASAKGNGCGSSASRKRFTPAARTPLLEPQLELF